MDEMKTLIDIIEKLHADKYAYDFEIVNGNELVCRKTCETFTPGEVIVEEAYRFEGDSNPDDMSVIYAITSNSGTRGILIDAYGTYSNPDIDEFIKKAPQREQSSIYDKKQHIS